MRSGWENFTGPALSADFDLGFAAGVFAALLLDFPEDFFAGFFAALLVGIGVSRTISRAGLSSRNPLNTAWRTCFCAVKPRNTISATSVGSTQMPLRPRSSAGILPKAGVSRR